MTNQTVNTATGTNQSLSGTTFGDTVISAIGTRTMEQLAPQRFDQPYIVVNNQVVNTA